MGETQQDLDKGKDGFVGGSGDAYKKMYPKVRNALQNNEKVTIEYTDIQLEPKEKPQESNDMYKKLQEISGEIKTLNAKLDGKNII